MDICERTGVRRRACVCVGCGSSAAKYKAIVADCSALADHARDLLAGNAIVAGVASARARLRDAVLFLTGLRQLEPADVEATLDELDELDRTPGGPEEARRAMVVRRGDEYVRVEVRGHVVGVDVDARVEDVRAYSPEGGRDVAVELTPREKALARLVLRGVVREAD